jgi:transposase InsO family protein
VRRVLAKHYRSGDSGSEGRSWLTFIAQKKDSLWRLDLFRSESILLRSHWVLVALDLFTRRIVGFGIAREFMDGISVCRMFNDAIFGQPLPKRVSTDHDPLFRFHRWLANLRVLEIEQVKSVPYVPVSHPYVERLIGTIRRELLDRTSFWNGVDLARKLEAYRDYCNEHRVHRALNGGTPEKRAGAPSPIHAKLDRYAWRRIVTTFSRRRFRRDYEFATDRSRRSSHTPPGPFGPLVMISGAGAVGPCSCRPLGMSRNRAHGR